VRLRIKRKKQKVNCGEHYCHLQADHPITFAIEIGAEGLNFLREFVGRLIQAIGRFDRSLGADFKCGAAVFHS